MNIGACQPTVHRVTKGWTRLSAFIFFHFLIKICLFYWFYFESHHVHICIMENHLAVHLKH